MNIIDELERLDGLATKEPEFYYREWCGFSFAHRRAIIRMLRAGEKVVNEVLADTHGEHTAKLPNDYCKVCQALHEYQTAKESI